MSLFQTARRFNMEVQPQLVLLQKTLLNIEGMGRQIYPELDLWETAAPYMESWMKERIGLSGFLRQFGEAAPGLVTQLPEIPKLALNALSEFKQITARSREQTLLLREMNQNLAAQQRSQKRARLGGYALVAALLGSLVPLTGFASPQDALVGASLLGSLGIYWMFIRP